MPFNLKLWMYILKYLMSIYDVIKGILIILN